MRAAWRDARAHGTLRIHPLSPRTRAQVLTLRQVKDLNETQTHLATALRELGFVVYRAGESGPDGAVHDDRSLVKNTKRLYDAARTHRHRWDEPFPGLARLPETRCFFVGGEFAYAVANSTHSPGKKFDLTSCPESASSRDLPAKYWRPHAALAKRVLDEVLPPLYSFDGRRNLCAERYAWPVRVDVGTHARADLDGLAEPSESRKQTCFVNEVEIVPTLYLAAKFGHRQDYVAAYGRALLKTAFEACGREAPAPDAPDTASSSPLAEANQSP